jgi:hypothetical protein
MNENSQTIKYRSRVRQGDLPASLDDLAGRSKCDAVDRVLNDARLNSSEKRAILSSWVSDAHAVVDQPALRRLDDGRVIAVDDILDALKAIDGEGGPRMRIGAASHRLRTVSRRGAKVGARWLSLMSRRKNSDDDDPPPSPAANASPVRLSSVDARAPLPSWRRGLQYRAFAAA